MLVKLDHETPRIGMKNNKIFELAPPTVDGRNPAPVDMVNIPLFSGFHTSLMVQEFLHQSVFLFGCNHRDTIGTSLAPRKFGKIWDPEAMLFVKRAAFLRGRFGNWENLQFGAGNLRESLGNLPNSWGTLGNFQESQKTIGKIIGIPLSTYCISI